MGREEQAEQQQEGGGGRGYREWEPIKPERRKFSTVNVPPALNWTSAHQCKRSPMVGSCEMPQEQHWQKSQGWHLLEQQSIREREPVLGEKDRADLAWMHHG